MLPQQHMTFASHQIVITLTSFIPSFVGYFPQSLVKSGRFGKLFSSDEAATHLLGDLAFNMAATQAY